MDICWIIRKEKGLALNCKVIRNSVLYFVKLIFIQKLVNLHGYKLNSCNG